MKAYLILVGTELLNGMMVDTNSLYIAEKLNKYGIEIVGKSLVGDNSEDIKNIINFSYAKVDLIILSGGLGPTIDDLTKEAIAENFGKKLIIDECHYENMKYKFSKRNIPVLKKNEKEVMVPEGSIVFENDPGIAPAFYFDKIAAFPGVPIELKNLFPKFLKYFGEKNNLNNKVYIKDVLVWGIPESVLEEKVISLFENVEGITFEFLVKDYGIIIRMQSLYKGKAKILKLRDEIKVRLGENFFGEDNDRLETLLVDKLRAEKLTISTAESCTGGMISSTFVNQSGVSDVFIEGIVTYSNESKKNRLGVSKNTLDKCGAVSSETVEEMLKGLKTDCGIAVSGIAGPGGGTKEKPVGTVYIGLKIKKKLIIKRYNFNGSREKIRQRTTLTAIYSLLKFLERGKDIC